MWSAQGSYLKTVIERFEPSRTEPIAPWVQFAYTKNMLSTTYTLYLRNDGDLATTEIVNLPITSLRAIGLSANTRVVITYNNNTEKIYENTTEKKLYLTDQFTSDVKLVCNSAAQCAIRIKSLTIGLIDKARVLTTKQGTITIQNTKNSNQTTVLEIGKLSDTSKRTWYKINEHNISITDVIQGSNAYITFAIANNEQGTNESTKGILITGGMSYEFGPKTSECYIRIVHADMNPDPQHPIGS